MARADQGDTVWTCRKRLNLTALPDSQRSVQRFPKILALGLGLLSATGFAPLNLWPVLLLCLAATMHLVISAPDLRSALARGYWFGVGQFALALNWIAGAFRYQDSMPVWLGWGAVVLLAFYLAIYPAMAAGLAWRHGRARLSVFILFFAAAWIATEWLRASLFTGFAWNPLGLSLVDSGAIARAVGTYGLSGVACLAAGGMLLLYRRDWIAAAAAMSLPLLSALASFAIVPGPTDGPPQPLVYIVQPNIGQGEKHSAESETAHFERYAALTQKPGSTPRLMFWPESAAPGFIESEAWGRARVASVLGPDDVLLTGGDALVYDKKGELVGAHNSVFAVLPDATLQLRYDKAHLLPYGEYVPFRAIMEPLGLSRLVPGDIDFLPGPGPQTFVIPGFGPRGIKAGIQICYEIVFSGHVVDRTKRPDFIFNPSNDAWFNAWGPVQFVAQARLRALEEGLPVIRATPTGISAIIDADGKIVRALPYEKPGFIEARLPRAHEPTLFARYGNILAFTFALFLTLIGIALRRSLR
jgi:apolipoprotein N-acyltransferase